MTLPSRILEKFEPEPNSGCWLWMAGRFASGYGQIAIKRKPRKAHRIIYELMVGPVPAGMELDHLCRVRACVNPRHLEAVSHVENVRRSPIHDAARTACPHGHGPYDKVYYRAGKFKGRYCSECKRVAGRKKLAKLRLVKRGN